MADKKILSRQKIALTPNDNTLVGKIQPDAEHIYVLLNSTIAFTVTLPDVQTSMQSELIFKNIGACDVTIVPQAGQFLDKATTHTIRPLDTVSFWSDLDKTWWILADNMVNPYPLNGPCADIATAIALVNQMRLALIAADIGV
jgi:hypothetical protein